MRECCDINLQFTIGLAYFSSDRSLAICYRVLCKYTFARFPLQFHCHVNIILSITFRNKKIIFSQSVGINIHI